MKSRLLSSATVLVLLLGLVSTNLFGQITNVASVGFLVKSFSRTGVATMPAPETASTGLDTVGRAMEVLARWETPSQFLASVEYMITFPKGTVLFANAEDSVYINYKDGVSEVQIKVDPANVGVVANDTAGYSSGKTPSITVTDYNKFHHFLHESILKPV